VELKTQSPVSLSLCIVSALVGCEGIIEDPSGLYALSAAASEASAEQGEAPDAAVVTDEVESAAPTTEAAAVSGKGVLTSSARSERKPAAAAAPSATPVENAAASLSARVGSGELSKPLAGPAPLEAALLSGEPFQLVKNWDFGAGGTIRSRADLEAEFEFHDQFDTIANGTNYGSVILASCEETAIGAHGLGLPSDEQPTENAARPTREWTDAGMLSHVRPLSESQQTVSVARHDAGNGSLMAKWSLPHGGALLGHDMVWETRVRMTKPLPGYWFALWTSGNRWDRGAEMDVVESFGAPHIPADAFHSDSVGGTNMVEYKSWHNALDQVGVPEDARDLTEWHTWTWLYNRDDSYEVFYDGKQVQHGVLHWTHGGEEGGEPIDMRFLFDFSWGHTQVSDVNIELPASDFPLTYEIDYSRVYLR
jgi:hypothetical protein